MESDSAEKIKHLIWLVLRRQDDFQRLVDIALDAFLSGNLNAHDPISKISGVMATPSNTK